MTCLSQGVFCSALTSRVQSTPTMFYARSFIQDVLLSPLTPQINTQRADFVLCTASLKIWVNLYSTFKDRTNATFSLQPHLTSSPDGRTTNLPHLSSRTLSLPLLWCHHEIPVYPQRAGTTSNHECILSA